MKQRLALRILAQLLNWSDEVAQAEFAWLKLMSRLKYDSYQGYLVGVRFVESLVVWLEQVAPDDRQVAYNLVRKQLVFVSALEMRRLVERFYPRQVEPQLVKVAAAQSATPSYLVWATPAATQLVSRLRRQTLFIGLSDGARMDLLRRANTGIITNEQTVLAPMIDDEKWVDLGNELAQDLPTVEGAPRARFNCVYLIDDLTASGTTLIRYDSQKKAWKGKLKKFRDHVWSARARLKGEFPLEEDFVLRVHHYIATEAAVNSVRCRCDEAALQHADVGWFAKVEFSEGIVLGPSATLAASDPFEALATRYYDPDIENAHSAESGTKEMQFGYSAGRLTVVLEHNTPNNSLSLLWAETAGTSGRHSMRPLFRRRSRHV